MWYNFDMNITQKNAKPLHKIRQYILDYLSENGSGSFGEMCPLKTATNAYSYHLTTLEKEGFIKKNGKKYELSGKGKNYLSGGFEFTQNMVIVLLKNGEIYKTRVTGEKRLIEIAQEISSEKVLEYSGDMYVRVKEDKYLIRNELLHIFTNEIPEQIQEDKYSPEIPEIIFMLKIADGKFFAERIYDII